MKAAYLKIVIGKGHTERITEFKKSFPEADDVSITYYRHGRTHEVRLDMKTFLDLLEEWEHPEDN